MVGADQLQMDFSPLDLVIAISPLCLMALDAPPRRSDDWTLASPDNIIV